MTLYCICVQTSVVTCGNMRTFKLFRNVLPEAICCCLQKLLYWCYVAIDGLCVY